MVGWLMRLMVFKFWQRCRFFGLRQLTICNCNLRITLRIFVKTLVMVCRLLEQIPFSALLSISKMLVVDLILGAYCSTDVPCHYYCHNCKATHNTLAIDWDSLVPLLVIFQFLPWWLRTCPLFRSFSLHQLVCSIDVGFAQASFNLFEMSTYPELLCFLEGIKNLLVWFLEFFHSIFPYTSSSSILSCHNRRQGHACIW